MFPRTVLKVVPSGEERYYLTTFNTGVFTLKLRLPPDTWCDQCILQWTYTVIFLNIDPSQCTHISIRPTYLIISPCHEPSSCVYVSPLQCVQDLCYFDDNRNTTMRERL